ncbi:rCG62735 [Rattus norvegicus]|uniref:RCG62735 n=1 Tax=Rattus norvegicus TaxID=10116 RepID=A6J653_RAT|nr:rCG62735 [Rattus norvegicus]
MITTKTPNPSPHRPPLLRTGPSAGGRVFSPSEGGTLHSALVSSGRTSLLGLFGS